MELSKFSINFFDMYARAKSKSFYYKDVLVLLSNSFLRTVNEKELKIFETIRQDIVDKNMVYVSSSYILSKLKNKETKSYSIAQKII